MRRMNVIVIAIGVVAVLAIGTGWFACSGWKMFGARFEDDASSAVQIDEIRVTGRSVALEVRPSDEAGVRIHRTARYLNPLHDRPGATHRIDGTVLHLGGDDSCTFCVIEYVVTAPEGVRVIADVTMGSLDLAGVSTVDATLSTGSLTVVDATGDVTMRAETGSITGTGLRSDAVVASTGTGAISLDLASPADVEARAGTGSVDLTVPRSAYRVDASTGLGEVKLGFPDDPNGSHRLSLRAGTGQVTLAAR